jgi:DNA-binding transcriptional regulator YiaG
MPAHFGPTGSFLEKLYEEDRAMFHRRLEKLTAQRKRINLKQKRWRAKIRQREPVYVPPTAEMIKKLRKEILGMTQIKFAYQLGVNVLTVRFWERYNRPPSRRNALKMAYLALQNGIKWGKLEHYVPGYNTIEGARRPH